MKEELLRILSVKLDDININIDSLTELNKKISKADSNLAYIKEMLNRFKDDDKNNVLNLTRFSSDEFDNILSLVSNDVSDVFKTKNCNYEGLVYLINGINNGVSLSLTIEQENAINYLIDGMEELMRKDMAVVDGLNLVKTRFAIDDVDVLNAKKEDFTKIIDELNNDKYVDEVDDVCEAMKFSNLDASNMSEMLVYLLKYNADIYDNSVDNDYSFEENKEEIEVSSDQEETKEEEVPLVEKENLEIDKSMESKEEKEIEEKDDIEFHLPEFNRIEDEKDIVIPSNYEIPIMPEVEENKVEIPETNISMEDVNVEIPNSIDLTDVNEESFEHNEEVSLEDLDVENRDIDDDFNDIVPQDDYEEYKPLEETISMTPVNNDKTSTREVQRLFQEFDINIDDSELNEYLDGDVEEYKKIINVLKSNGILNNVVNNKGLFREVIVNSKESEVIDALNIIKNDLSVDSEDYETTLKIAIDTIPSIFVGNNGNYENFAQNVKLFKDLGINLVNLFDFSKEVLIANHDAVLNNYEIVKNMV